MSELIYIKTDLIDPHPDNPRKEIGDVSELADSIKKSGILQNLTVVPWFSGITKEKSGKVTDRYRVVIGHRRLAASKLAGLKEVPCVVSDMDYKEQVATMLAENMQRSDLTVYEQAQGMQLMLELGEDIKSISERTGFSESTVRRRTKLLVLDKEKFKEGVARGASLFELEEIEKIEDEEERNKLLDVAGTKNFANAIYSAKRTQEQNKLREQWKAVLSPFAEAIPRGTNLSGKDVVKSYYPGTDKIENFVIPEDSSEVKYYYSLSNYCAILYKEQVAGEEEDEEQTEEDILEELNSERAEKACEMGKRFYQLRYDFIKNYPANKIDIETVAAHYVVLKSRVGYYYSFNEKTYLDLLGVKTREDSACKVSFKKAFLCAVYTEARDDETTRYSNWNGDYTKSKDLDMIYDFLCDIGYEMSDEEEQAKAGTHELFKEICEVPENVK